MELKQKTILEVEIEGRAYQLECPIDAPLGQLHDALMQMKGYCVERMVQAQKEEQEVAAEKMKDLDRSEKE